MRTYSPLGTDHPAPAQDFPIFPHSSERITGVVIAYAKAIRHLRMVIGLGRITQRFEIFDGLAVFVWWVAEDNDVRRLVVLWC